MTRIDVIHFYVNAPVRARSEAGSGEPQRAVPETGGAEPGRDSNSNSNS